MFHPMSFKIIMVRSGSILDKYAAASNSRFVPDYRADLCANSKTVYWV